MAVDVLRFRGTVTHRNEASACLEKAGDAVLVQRGVPRILLIRCPCGCGEEFPINLDKRSGPAWRLYIDERTGLSLYPSVWRESGCHSHYVIWRNKIFLFGRYEEDLSASTQAGEIEQIIPAIQSLLPTEGLIPFSKIADALDMVPWDVLTACRRLVRQGIAREGKDKERGSFGRK